MKKHLLILLTALFALSVGAKDIKTLVVTPQPQMTCANCEKKIQQQLKFEKGVKSVATDLEAQTITVQYNADKTSEKKILASLEKIGYTAAKPQNAKKCKECTAKKSCDKDKKSCDKDKKCCKGEKKCCCGEKKSCEGEKTSCPNEKKPCCEKK